MKLMSPCGGCPCLPRPALTVGVARGGAQPLAVGALRCGAESGRTHGALLKRREADRL